MPLLRPVDFRQLLGDIGSQQQVAALESVLLCLEQVFRGLPKISALARDHADVAQYFAAPRGRILRGNSQKILALRERFVETAGSDIQLDLVDREVELAGAIPVFLKRLG